eukprot:GFKZ01009448.1.p1 GENE.GFKZ01009448.1~~GFKZ01009448.1.p1  ORF type:complete len:269 (-),score=31.25 GFKZ01009448.1:1337-2086(-)
MALEDFRLRFGKAMMELTGTAILLLTIQLCVGAGSPLAPFTIGVVLIAIVYAGGPISGAHYNPAVSLSIFLRGKMSLHEMLMYWVFQIAGGVLGALLGAVIGGKLTAITRGADVYLLQAFLAEFVFTGVLCFVVLAVATTSKAEDNQYYAVAIGLTVTAGAVSVGHISGGAFNPAVALGLGIVKHFWKMIYVSWVILANAAGAVAGTAVFYIVAPDEFAHFGDEAHGLMDNARARVGEARSLLPGSQAS